MEWRQEVSSSIVRLCLRRSLPVRAKVGSLNRVEVILASEFYDIVSGLLSKCAVYCSIQEAETKVGVGEESLLESKWMKEDIGGYDILAPKKEGLYHIALRGVVHGDNEVMVLSWTSDVFEVCKEDMVLEFTPKMLTCLREFHTEESKVFRIREDYGAGMGTHIYDGAVVLMRFLLMRNDAGRRREGLALELGSGCGVLGVFLGTIYESVLLTDKGAQLPLLTRNIAENRAVTECCHSEALDWGSSRDWLALAEKMKTLPRLQAVYASDVLYDAEAARHLKQLLREISSLPGMDRGTREVVIAQKMRGEEAVDVPKLFKDFSPRLAVQESFVAVWCLRV